MRGLERRIALLLFGNVFVWGANAFADTDSLVVSMGIKEEYNDNIFFEPNQEVDDFITTLSPGISLQRNDERTSASLRGLFDIAMYSDYSDLNNVDQFYGGDISHKVTPRLSFSGKASYKRDSRPDRDVEETGLLLGTDVRRAQHYQAGLGYVLSEKSDVNVGYVHRRDDFDAPDETDYDSHTVNVRLKYNLSYWFPLTIGRINSAYSRYNYPSTGVDNYNLTFGFEKQLTEIYSYYADLGGRYTNPEGEADDSYGGVVRCGLKYNGELTNASVVLSHDTSPASGNKGLRERTSGVVSVKRKFAERIAGELSGGYYLNKSDSGELSDDDTDTRTMRISPRLSYRVAEHLWFEASYTYTQILDKETPGDDTYDRNLVFVRLVLDQPFFE